MATRRASPVTRDHVIFRVPPAKHIRKRALMGSAD